tara:strand:- start:626 stop:889 length:264 start_codon:yes stop_codon:yes gene_type:complete
VDLAKKQGLSAIRAFGSDGRSLGLPSDVDFVIKHNELRIKGQAKRRKSEPKYFKLGNADILVFRGDRKRNKVVMDYEFFLKCLSRVH